jgi:hypothetical protein
MKINRVVKIECRFISFPVFQAGPLSRLPLHSSICICIQPQHTKPVPGRHLPVQSSPVQPKGTDCLCFPRQYRLRWVLARFLPIYRTGWLRCRIVSSRCRRSERCGKHCHAIPANLPQLHWRACGARPEPGCWPFLAYQKKACSALTSAVVLMRGRHPVRSILLISDWRVEIPKIQHYRYRILSNSLQEQWRWKF